VAAVLATSITGCNDGRPRRVPVSGKVTLDGNPLSFGQVQFVAEHGRPAGAMIMPDGSFKLTCYELNDGCTLGTHRVAVTVAKPMSPTATQWLAPKKYSKTGSSGIEITIDEATEDLLIELEGEDGKPFKPFIERLRP